GRRLVQPPGRVLAGEHRRASEARVVALRLGSVPEGHHRVADELVDGPAGSTDGARHRLQVGAERLGEVAWRKALGEPGEAFEVGEEDGQLARFPAGDRIDVLA